MIELREVYDGNLRLDETVVRRSGILGVVEGTFFVAGKPSRNGRIYPYELWENVLKNADVRRLLENRLMFGTVGHEDIDLDALIREQKVSHVVTDLKLLSDGTGYGRAEILDTPVGRILYNLLKTGSKLSVSSKGWGEYRGMTQDGLYEVDPQQYVLERFDFVVDPGFFEAQPQLKKAYESVIKGKKEGEKMADSLEVVLKEKIMLQRELSEAMEKVRSLEQEIRKLKEEKVKEVGGNSEKVEEIFRIGEEMFGFSKENFVEGLKKLARRVERLGLVLEEMGVKKEELEGKDVNEVLRNMIVVLRKAGEIVERRERDKEEDSEIINRRFRALRRRVMELREENENLRKLLYESRKVLKRVEKLGGIDMVEKALLDAYRFIVFLGDKELKESAQSLANKYGIKMCEAKELVKRLGVRGAEETLEKAAKKKLDEVRKPEVVVTEKTILDESILERGFKFFGR